MNAAHGSHTNCLKLLHTESETIYFLKATSISIEVTSYIGKALQSYLYISSNYNVLHLINDTNKGMVNT